MTNDRGPMTVGVRVPEDRRTHVERLNGIMAIIEPAPADAPLEPVADDQAAPSDE